MDGIDKNLVLVLEHINRINNLRFYAQIVKIQKPLEQVRSLRTVEARQKLGQYQ